MSGPWAEDPAFVVVNGAHRFGHYPQDWQPQDMIRIATNALRHFGGPMDRGTASRLLAAWVHAHLLTDAERQKVLEGFPEHV